MADTYDERPDELARFYAERMAHGYGPAIGRKLDWTLRDARYDGDGQRSRFWQRVRSDADTAAEARAG